MFYEKKVSTICLDLIQNLKKKITTKNQEKKVRDLKNKIEQAQYYCQYIYQNCIIKFFTASSLLFCITLFGLLYISFLNYSDVSYDIKLLQQVQKNYINFFERKKFALISLQNQRYLLNSFLLNPNNNEFNAKNLLLQIKLNHNVFIKNFQFFGVLFYLGLKTFIMISYVVLIIFIKGVNYQQLYQ